MPATTANQVFHPHGDPDPANVAPNDPTVAFVKKFNDPAQWKIKKDVPIFIEHDEPNPETGEVEHFGEAELKELADNCNRLVKSGNPPGLTLGHTFSKAKETDQPITVGYGKNYRVGKSPLDGKLRIYHDEWVKPEHAELSDTFPSRSVERWREGRYFKPVALLRREPALNLGIASYSADARQHPRQLTPSPLLHSEQLSRYCAPANGDTVTRYSKEVYAMDDDMAQGAPPQGAPPPTAPSEYEMAEPKGEAAMLEPTDKDKALFHKLCMAHPMMGKMLKQYEGAAAAPAPADLSATNGGVPAPEKMGAPPAEGEEEEIIKKKVEPMPPMQSMQNSGDPVRYAKMERELTELRKQSADTTRRIADAERRERQAVRYSALRDLHNDGYTFDLDEEAKDTADLSDAGFEKHLGKMVKNYQKANFGPRIVPAKNAPQEQSGQAIMDSFEKVSRYMQEHEGVSYDDALAKYAKESA